MLPELVKHVPAQFNKYIEPFAGGGALFFRLRPSCAILADANPDLINCYEVVQERVEELIAILRTYPYDRDFFYGLRSATPANSVERAARLVYLNRTCFNGLYRVNKKGQFNVPFGLYTNPTICDVDRLRAASRALAGVKLVRGDYRNVLKEYAQPGDFVYADPPYHPVSKYSDFKRYTQEFFYEEDQKGLAEIVRGLAARGCYVIVSNSWSEPVLRMYEGFEVFRVPARRLINKDPSKRQGAEEAIIVTWS